MTDPTSRLDSLNLTLKLCYFNLDLNLAMTVSEVNSSFSLLFFSFFLLLYFCFGASYSESGIGT